MESAPAVSVRDVCFSFGSSEVLHNVSFELPSRSFTAVIGPNGGGKTTLLRLLLGELSPRWGSVEVFGLPPEKARGRVGFVPQFSAFDPDFPITVGEAVALGVPGRGAFGGFSRADREAAASALARVGLGGFGSRPFAARSGGEKQRVLVAQALVRRPALLLLDEPTANVDPETEGALYDLFASLAAESAVVMVSHDRDVVSRRATHLLCVNRGVDLHALGGADGEAVLEPIAGHDRARVLNEHPGHVEDLGDRAGRTPHRGERHC